MKLSSRILSPMFVLLLVFCCCILSVYSSQLPIKLQKAAPLQVSRGSEKVVVFGATGGLGQWCCKFLEQDGYEVNAVTRNVGTASQFKLLEGSNLIKADAKVLDESLKSAVNGASHIIVSVGTTAFPTKKWEDGLESPVISCVQTVRNILSAVEETDTRPRKIVLLSSIGVERTDKFPFKLLNSFGILDAKLASERLLIEKCRNLSLGGCTSIVVRPGRLIGAPFTNFDLAKLLQKDQGQDQGIIIDVRENLAGDVERRDVAELVARLIKADIADSSITLSVINKPGEKPDERKWATLLSLFTVPREDLLIRRES